MASQHDRGRDQHGVCYDLGVVDMDRVEEPDKPEEETAAVQSWVQSQGCAVEAGEVDAASEDASYPYPGPGPRMMI